MADWVNITDSQVDPDAPLTSELAYAWRDNIAAMAEGAVGAPGIRAAGLWQPTAGDVAMLSAPNVAESAGTSVLTLVSGKFMAFGTVRMKVTARRGTSGLATMILRRIRTGVTTALDSVVLTTTAQTRSVDVTVKPHDTIAIVVTRSASSEVTATGISISTGGEDLWLFDYAPADAVLDNGDAPS